MPDLWSVSELNRYVKQSLEMDYRLQDLRVAGAVSGFRAYPSGHWYFTLNGEGALFQEFLRLKAWLEVEGLFAAERKRPLPAWPRRIAVVTSPAGAAVRD